MSEFHFRIVILIACGFGVAGFVLSVVNLHFWRPSGGYKPNKPERKPQNPPRGGSGVPPRNENPDLLERDNRDELAIKEVPTLRGFARYEFQDYYLQACSIQDSSLATKAAIWLGVDNSGPHLKGPRGNFGEPIDGRMHLTSSQVEDLLPILQRFVENGFIDEQHDG